MHHVAYRARKKRAALTGNMTCTWDKGNPAGGSPAPLAPGLAPAAAPLAGRPAGSRRWTPLCCLPQYRPRAALGVVERRRPADASGPSVDDIRRLPPVAARPGCAAGPGGTGYETAWPLADTSSLSSYSRIICSTPYMQHHAYYTTKGYPCLLYRTFSPSYAG